MIYLNQYWIFCNPNFTIDFIIFDYWPKYVQFLKTLTRYKKHYEFLEIGTWYRHLNNFHRRNSAHYLNIWRTWESLLAFDSTMIKTFLVKYSTRLGDHLSRKKFTNKNAVRNSKRGQLLCFKWIFETYKLYNPLNRGQR